MNGNRSPALPIETSSTRMTDPSLSSNLSSTACAARVRAPLMQPFEGQTRLLERLLFAAEGGIMPAARGHRWRLEQSPQQAGDGCRPVGGGTHVRGDAQTQQAAAIVELVEDHRHGQLGEPRRERLPNRPYAAVVDERGGLRQQCAKRDEVEMPDVARQGPWQLLR